MAKAKILLVEDSKTQAEVAKGFLEKEGYEVIWVPDGKSAIKTARTQTVDVILLDLILPDMNGNEVCRWLKLNDITKGVPIIMLTVKSDVSDKVAGLEAGADDYLPKPYNEVELNARIYASLRTKALQDELRHKNRQLESLLRQVEVMAVTDQLTGLYNRRHIETVLKKEFKKTVRYGSLFSCLMIDIDNFKGVNDLYGHQTGDVVLKEIAGLISKNAREVDTVARWGGEEFIVFLHHTKKEDAVQFASRILKAVSGHKFSSMPEKQLTVSIGLAGIPDSAIDTEEGLIQAVDCALYEAKRKGRNRVEIICEA